MKVLDSTLLVDLIRGKEEALKVLNKDETFLTTQINMFEVIRGLFLRKVSKEKFPQAINLFSEIRVLPLDDKAMIKAAEISSQLYHNGNIIDDCDCLIAGIALSNGINKVITRDVEHFKRIKGIKVETY